MDSNGKAVAIATPGANFEVLVTVHPSCDVKFSQTVHAEAHLSLDGVSPGYSNLFNQANTTSFKYFSGAPPMNFYTPFRSAFFAVSL